MKQILALSHARKSYDGKVVLDDVTLGFLPGAKIGVVGPNGMGKSTLLRMMAGLEQPSNGEVRLMPGYSVGILAQEPALDEGKTVLGNVEEGVAGTRALIGRYNEVAAKMAADYSGDLLEEMGRLQEKLDHRDAWDLDSRVEQAMDALRCPPPDADVSVLSGGERRRVALCRLLLSQPDLLLLDEPTNHLDAESVAWLEQHLGKYPGTVVAVTHDRYFLDNVAGWILELDRGRAYPYEGNYSTYLETKAARMKVEGQRDAKLRRRLEEELEWVRSSPRARQAKSRARLGRYEQMAAEAASRQKLDFEEIQIPPGPRLGSLVVEADQPGQGVRGPDADRRAQLQPAAERHRRGYRPERGRQDHLAEDDPRGGSAGRRDYQGRRDGADLLCRPAACRDRPGQDRVGGDLRRAGLYPGRAGRDPQPRVCGGVRVQGIRPAEAGRAHVRRGARPGEPGAHPQAGRATCCCWTSPPTTWTWRPWPRWRTRWASSPAAR